MIYTFGSSLTKYYWPTWADWMSVYCGPVTNLAYVGYDVTKTYYTLVEYLDRIKKDDTVYIMWPGNTTISVWYDDDWITANDCRRFFPNSEGDLWYTQNTPWQGLYKQHPNNIPSFTHLLVHNWQCIINAQLLLEKIGCDYRMMFTVNPWIDMRPVYNESYHKIWHKITNINAESVSVAHEVIKLSPVEQLIKVIDHKKYIGVPADIKDLKNYQGIWEYELKNKEYTVLKNKDDMHPVSLAYHDYLLEHILNRDAVSGEYRDRAIAISKECATMLVPRFTKNDYTAPADMQLSTINIIGK